LEKILDKSLHTVRPLDGGASSIINTYPLQLPNNAPFHGPYIPQKLLHFNESNVTLLLKDLGVKLPIIKHVFIIKHFPIFSSFLNQIERLLCHWTCKMESYKCSCYFNGKSKGNAKKLEDDE
jgi:hypothetical protein